jgi:hypothetical protein
MIHTRRRETEGYRRKKKGVRQNMTLTKTEGIGRRMECGTAINMAAQETQNVARTR